MSQEDMDALKNASAIIERFGGIRPMAAKVGAPVTTVQGWKKRDVIPGARREDVIKAANDNGIDISDILDGSSVAAITGATAEIVSEGVVKASDSAFVDPKEEDAKSSANEPKITIEPIFKSQPKPLPASFQTKIDTTHDDLMAVIAATQKKAMRTSLWTAAAFVAVIGAGLAFVLWPSAQKIEKHEVQIATLEGKMGAIDTDVQSMNETANFLKGMVPQEVERGMAQLQEKAAEIQKTVTDVAIQAEDLRERVLATDAGSLGDRLSVLEAKFSDMEGGQALADLTSRIRNLEVSFMGQEQLGASVDELRKIVDSMDGQFNTLETRLADTQKQPSSQLGQTLEGVSGSDLKAAAMLIAFSQLRDSLNRNAPFEDDLALLQKLVGKDDPALQDALVKLAPQAQKGGVLTQAGLSSEFRTMAGDIVVSSLKGEDVSVAEKAKVRLTEIINVKKDGQQIGGNATQQAVTTAQAQLDSGDIQGAIATLQALDGPAQTTAQPFIDQAQATLLAEQIQNMLRQTILAQVGADVSTASGSTPSASGVTDAIQKVLPQNEVVEDPESGFAILPAPKGFKGFSSGDAE